MTISKNKKAEKLGNPAKGKGKSIKLPLPSSTKKPRGVGVRFKPNDPATGFIDERINRTGQNAKFTEVRHLAQRLFDEMKTVDVTVHIGAKETKASVTMSRLEEMLRDWIDSHDYQKQSRALEYAVGKVPDQLQIQNSEVEEFVKSNIDIFTDGQIDRLRAGENPLSILAEIMREYREKQNPQ